jgi:hypothetical protein
MNLLYYKPFMPINFIGFAIFTTSIRYLKDNMYLYASFFIILSNFYECLPLLFVLSDDHSVSGSQDLKFAYFNWFCLLINKSNNHINNFIASGLVKCQGVRIPLLIGFLRRCFDSLIFFFILEIIIYVSFEV